MLEDHLSKLDRDGLLDEITRSSEVNRQLQFEMKILKEQYNEALNFSSKMEEFSGENNNLKKQISELRLMVDDLQRRLQISQQTNFELTNIKDKLKANVDKSNSDEISDLQMQLGIAKSENINLKSRYQQQIKEIESSLYSAQSENALFQKQQAKILFVIGNYLNEKIETPQVLFQKISSIQQEAKSNDVDANVANHEQNKNEQNKIKILRNNYLSEKQKRKDIQMAIVKMKKMIDQENLSHEEEIVRLNDVINQQKNEIQRLELVNQQNSLKIDPPQPKRRNAYCQSMLTEISENVQIENFKHQLTNANTEIEAQSAHISMLKMQIDTLMKQISDCESSKTLLSTKLKELNNQRNEVEKNFLHEKNENDLLLVKYNELLCKSDQKSSSNETPLMKLESKLKMAQINLNNKQNAIDNMEKIISCQRNEIQELSMNKENLINAIEKQNQMLNIYNTLCQKKISGKEKIVEKIITVEPKIKWPIEYLPPDIVDIIKDISENDSMSIESRIKNVMIVINKWISQTENSFQKEINLLNENNSTLEKEFLNFKNKLVNIIKEEDDEIIDEDSICTYFYNMSQKFGDLEKEIKDIKEIESSLFGVAEVEDLEGLINKQQSLLKDNKNLLDRLENEKKKRSSLKKQFKAYCEEREQESKKQNELHIFAKENSRKQIEQLQLGIDNLQKQNKSLIEQIKEVNKDNQSFNKDCNKEAKVHKHMNGDESTDFNDAMSRTQAIFANEELHQQIKSLEKSSQAWKEAAQKAHTENTKAQVQFEKCKEEYEMQINQLLQKHEIENSQNSHTIQELSDKLKVLTEDNKVALNKLNESLMSANKMYDESLQNAVNLKYENEKIKLTAAATIESIERSKKLCEAQLKAKILSIDSNYAMLLEEEKQRTETEKRELIEYFVKSFKLLCNVNSEMNEEAFRELVRKVKAEFEKNQRTEDAIRKLIKANDKDTIEDALTQFIIHNHPQFQDK